MEKTRLNKYLSECGFCSRRKADELIECGHVTVNDVKAVMGTKVGPEDVITVKGKTITKADEAPIIIAFNKPVGIVCTTSKSEKDNIVDYINYHTRIYPIGRLDKYSEGLILLTNNGEFVNKIMRSRNQHEKEYLVSVDRQLSPEFLDKMSKGVRILGTVTKPCKICQTGAKEFKIILTQGLNRQIRRMCAEFDYRVVSLKRIRIMNIHLGDLPLGEIRKIDEKELQELESMLVDSDN
ncbi:pseudouridine synthase [Candidatus Methanomassiliicoccus intestinalis]|uniref:pseudouridine synthase n=1 Tax=Candidatus Methanomassiliicoccus intestinalis TaxID=1406512 RepID=UPI0037DC8572